MLQQMMQYNLEQDAKKNLVIDGKVIMEEQQPIKYVLYKEKQSLLNTLLSLDLERPNMHS